MIPDVNLNAKHLQKLTNKIHQSTKHTHIDNTTIKMSEIQKDDTQFIQKNKPDTSSNKTTLEKKYINLLSIQMLITQLLT